ncbi:uncharacterized protein EDB91DRAFT_294197 [Suillus paluster]|uniref:uncharacterized protein n=1 Tax=Suillus paluster TaxID=48578 RepID=UPI001B868AA0|nr:uncharacterized protein EDB91DRAFT_294197 [Suillus paluster]KAG1742718.1 hypothetical protein EDB91DRAFT_294197 [Suillus paluster]
MTEELKNDCEPFLHPFVNGARVQGGVGDPARTVIDLAMSELSRCLRRREGWWTLFNCPETRAQWAAEALAEPTAVRVSSNDLRVWLTPRQVEYVLEELQGYAKLRDVEDNWQVSCFERIWESEAIFDDSMRASLDRQLSRFLETLPDKLAYREGDELTRHIIDPYLYPLIYGRTLAYDPAREEFLRPEPVPSVTDVTTTDFLSQEFASLPCDFLISEGGTAKALSYINNLHPCYYALYRHFEELISKCIPMFEHVLTDLKADNPIKERIQGPSSSAEWDEPEAPDFSRDFADWSAYESKKRQWIMRRSMEPDVPTTGYPGGLEERRNAVQLRGKTLQVIFDVYEICIKPGGPAFQGFQWRVEGMTNENIVACVLHNSSSDNITGNSIEFRMAVKTPPGFPNKGHQDITLKTWGMQTGDPCHQHIGSVPIRQGLCIAFPNIYQYRFTPFSLVDPSKEGHQRIIGLYLVDPSIAPLASTQRVPPQQKAWTRLGVEKRTRGIFPVELVDKVLDEVDGVMDVDEAVICRERMVKERTRLSELNDVQHFKIPCNRRR